MNYPGYTLVRREDCPEQHGVLTVLKHDVSGAAVLLVENEDTNKAFGIGFGMHAASWVQIWLHGKQEKLLLTNRDSCDKL